MRKTGHAEPVSEPTRRAFRDCTVLGSRGCRSRPPVAWGGFRSGLRDTQFPISAGPPRTWSDRTCSRRSPLRTRVQSSCRRRDAWWKPAEARLDSVGLPFGTVDLRQTNYYVTCAITFRQTNPVLMSLPSATATTWLAKDRLSEGREDETGDGVVICRYRTIRTGTGLRSRAPCATLPRSNRLS